MFWSLAKFFSRSCSFDKARSLLFGNTTFSFFHSNLKPHLVVVFCNISIALLSFTVITLILAFGLVPYDSISKNIWIRLSADVSNANWLVIGQVSVLWLLPNNVQAHVLFKASLLLPDFISVFRCKFGWSAPINVLMFGCCGLSNGISLRWLYFPMTDDVVAGDVESWGSWTTKAFFSGFEWLHDEIEKLISFDFILLDNGKTFVNDISFVLPWWLSSSAKPLDIRIESDPMSNNAAVGIQVCPLLI